MSCITSEQKSLVSYNLTHSKARPPGGQWVNTPLGELVVRTRRGERHLRLPEAACESLTRCRLSTQKTDLWAALDLSKAFHWNLVRSGPGLEESVSRPQMYLHRFFHLTHTLLHQTPSQMRLPFIPNLGSLLVSPFCWCSKEAQNHPKGSPQGQEQRKVQSWIFHSDPLSLVVCSFPTQVPRSPGEHCWSLLGGFLLWLSHLTLFPSEVEISHLHLSVSDSENKLWAPVGSGGAQGNTEMWKISARGGWGCQGQAEWGCFLLRRNGHTQSSPGLGVFSQTAAFLALIYLCNRMKHLDLSVNLFCLHL